tara:strand:+ start:242 stop:421 length:180 start_codon:yes stop_codon:yes gene_type:complete
MILIPEPYIPTQRDIAKRELFVMQVNVRRMEHMINNGYCVDTYSEDEWQKFKNININKK